MLPIRCIAIDDEPPALLVLEKYIRSVQSLELLGCFQDALDALPLIMNRQVDLIFLDIQMPQLLGTDFIRTIKYCPKVIFTTAHRNFAVEGFDLDAVDYLLKPISFTRFLKAINKLEPMLKSPQPVAQAAEPGFILLRTNRKTTRVLHADILYIESIRDYIKVVTSSGTIISKQPISVIDNILPKSAFLRIHRSFIISVAKIRSFSGELVEIGQTELPISRMYRSEVEKQLNAKS